MISNVGGMIPWECVDGNASDGCDRTSEDRHSVRGNEHPGARCRCPYRTRQARCESTEGDEETVAVDVNHGAENRAGADGRVAFDACVAFELKDPLGPTSSHADDAMGKHASAMMAEQHVPAGNLARGHGDDGDGVAVSDGGVHAGALGSEAHHGPVPQGVFDHRTKGLRVTHV